MLIKSLKNIFGISANSSTIPAVRANDVYSHGACFFSNCGSSTIFFSASSASRGMVNSAMTSIDDTVRNFAYIGMLSMKKSVNGMKCFPHDNSIDRMVTASNAHFIGPFTINRPRINSIITKAPTYTGPIVIGCSPQYCPIC